MGICGKIYELKKKDTEKCHRKTEINFEKRN